MSQTEQSFEQVFAALKDGRVKSAVIDLYRSELILSLKKGQCLVLAISSLPASWAEFFASHNVPVYTTNTPKIPIWFVWFSSCIGQVAKAIGRYFSLRCLFLLIFVAPGAVSLFMQKLPELVSPGPQAALVRQAIDSEDVFVGYSKEKDALFDLIPLISNAAKQGKTRLGGRLPKGCLIEGPAGTGKTLLMREFAKELKLPCFACSGAELAGGTWEKGRAQKVKDLFKEAEACDFAIILIDDINAVGGKRAPEWHDTEASPLTNYAALNQLLVELDGFNEKSKFFVVATSSNARGLDPALRRRFERRVHLPLPSLKERKKLLKHFASGLKHPVKLNWLSWARQTVGMSGADLKTLFNEAALLAASADQPSGISESDMRRAYLKRTSGLGNKHAMVSEAEQRARAQKLAATALLAEQLRPGSVQFISNIPTLQDPEGKVGLALFETDDPLARNLDALAQSILITYAPIAVKKLCGQVEGTSPAESIALKQVMNQLQTYLALSTHSNRTCVALHSQIATDEAEAQTSAALIKSAKHFFAEAEANLVPLIPKIEALATTILELEQLDQSTFQASLAPLADTSTLIVKEAQ